MLISENIKTPCDLKHTPFYPGMGQTELNKGFKMQSSNFISLSYSLKFSAQSTAGSKMSKNA